MLQGKNGRVWRWDWLRRLQLRPAPPDNRELEKRIDLLTKDFEVMQANLDATLNALQASAAERDARQLSRLAAATGLIIAAIAASATILGVIIAGRRIQAEAM